MSINTIVERLESCRQISSNSYKAKCPAHADGSPSLAITEKEDGRILIHCFAGCGAHEILDAIGLEYSALFPPSDGQYRSLVAQLHTNAPRETIDSMVIEIAEHDRASGKKLSKKDVARYREAVKRNPKPSDTIVEIHHEAGALK